MAKDLQYGFFRDVQLTEDGSLITGMTSSQFDEIIYNSNNTQFSVAVAQGKIQGYEPFFKFGRNPDIDTGTTPEDVWNGGGEYTGFPTETETMEIFSSSNQDTAGGNGARTVIISNLLDVDCNEMPPVTVTLDGQNPVSIGTFSYHRCSRMSVETAGSANHNVGNLTLRHTTTTSNVFAVMPAELNQTQIFAYTVPMGKTLYIPSFSIKMSRSNGSPGSANVRVRLRDHGSNVWRTVRNEEITNGQSFEFNGIAYFIAEGGQDVKATVASVSDNNTIVNGSADGFLVSNGLH